MTEVTGRLAAFFSVILVLVTCYIVFSRYILNSGSIAVQETLLYMNAVVFMLGAAYTLKHNGHVRVDIIYSQASSRYRAWVDLLGTVLLLFPVCGFIIWISWDYVQAAWRVREQSAEAGGLAYVYLLKSLIVVMGVSLFLQGIAELLRALGRIRGWIAEPAPAGPLEKDEVL